MLTDGSLLSRVASGARGRPTPMIRCAGRPPSRTGTPTSLAVRASCAPFPGAVALRTIHHMDFEAAPTRMRDPLRPGGTPVVVGLARDVGVRERAATVAAAPAVRITKVLRRAGGPEGMPVADPLNELRAGAGSGAAAAAGRAPPPPRRAPVLTDLGQARRNDQVTLSARLSAPDGPVLVRRFGAADEGVTAESAVRPRSSCRSRCSGCPTAGSSARRGTGRGRPRPRSPHAGDGARCGRCRRPRRSGCGRG